MGSGVRAVFEQQLDECRIAADGGGDQSRSPIPTLSIDRRAILQQQARDLAISAASRFYQRCASPLTRYVHIRPAGQKHRHDVGEASAGSLIESGSSALVSGVPIRTRVEQQPDHRGMSAGGGRNECRC